MITAIERYLANLVDVVEGPAYTANATDRGGPTKYGITQKALGRYLRRPVAPNDVRDMTRDTALAIYRADYIELPGFDKLAVINAPVALECIDTDVNMGPGVATVTLQLCLNALGAALTVDGLCGAKTCAALQAFLQTRGADGQRILLLALNCVQGARYIDIAIADPTQKTFIFGWLRQRVQLVPDAKFYGETA